MPKSSKKHTRDVTNQRFPSGQWIGFYCDRGEAARHWMQLELTFSKGIIRGSGSDPSGLFVVRGRYREEDGGCRWSKRYVGGRDIFATGYNEGQGIWGVWELSEKVRGGYHIWPADMKLIDHEKILEAAQQPWVISLASESQERTAAQWLTGAEKRTETKDEDSP